MSPAQLAAILGGGLFVGGLVVAASALLIFVVAPWIVSVVIHELPWQPYSRVVLEQNLQEGRTVLVDFTAGDSEPS